MTRSRKALQQTGPPKMEVVSNVHSKLWRPGDPMETYGFVETMRRVPV